MGYVHVIKLLNSFETATTQLLMNLWLLNEATDTNKTNCSWTAEETLLEGVHKN